MADYTIISDLSAHIIKILRKSMCPEPISSENKIEICSPADEETDYSLGLYLYDIREEGQVTIPPLNIPGKIGIKPPPKPYGIYYMLFVNGSAKSGIKAPDIQKIIGKAAQIITDNNQILPSKLQNRLEIQEPSIVLSQAKISLEEKFRVWQAIHKPYQVSLFYRAAPVFLSSGIVRDTPLVTEAALGIKMISGAEGGNIKGAIY